MLLWLGARVGSTAFMGAFVLLHVVFSCERFSAIRTVDILLASVFLAMTGCVTGGSKGVAAVEGYGVWAGVFLLRTGAGGCWRCVFGGGGVVRECGGVGGVGVGGSEGGDRLECERVRGWLDERPGQHGGLWRDYVLVSG